MISIVLSACLASDPAACELRVAGQPSQDDFQTCSTEKDAAASSWAKAHPDFVVTSTYCMPGRVKS